LFNYDSTPSEFTFLIERLELEAPEGTPGCVVEPCRAKRYVFAQEFFDELSGVAQQNGILLVR